MKTTLLSLFILSSSFIEFVTENKKPETIQQTKTKCKYKEHTLYRGKRGGCFYINDNGNKTYVDRSYCNC